MRILHLALVLSLLAPVGAATAQDQTQPMIELARKMRAQAEQMKGSLPPEEIAEMLKQADEIEEGARAGGFNAPPPPAPTLSQRIADAHEGRLDWLHGKEACVGYSWESYRTFSFTPGVVTERDRLCRTAYGHWDKYFTQTRDGAGSAATEPHLAAYDKAAQAAVDYFNKGGR
jgi:hypothetical protein